MGKRESEFVVKTQFSLNFCFQDFSFYFIFFQYNKKNGCDISNI